MSFLKKFKHFLRKSTIFDKLIGSKDYIDTLEELHSMLMSHECDVPDYWWWHKDRFEGVKHIESELEDWLSDGEKKALERAGVKESHLAKYDNPSANTLILISQKLKAYISILKKEIESMYHPSQIPLKAEQLKCAKRVNSLLYEIDKLLEQEVAGFRSYRLDQLRAWGYDDEDPQITMFLINNWGKLADIMEKKEHNSSRKFFSDLEYTKQFISSEGDRLLDILASYEDISVFAEYLPEFKTEIEARGLRNVIDDLVSIGRIINEAHIRTIIQKQGLQKMAGLKKLKNTRIFSDLTESPKILQRINDLGADAVIRELIECQDIIITKKIQKLSYFPWELGIYLDDVGICGVIKLYAELHDDEDIMTGIKYGSIIPLVGVSEFIEGYKKCKGLKCFDFRSVVNYALYMKYRSNQFSKKDIAKAFHFIISHIRDIYLSQLSSHITAATSADELIRHLKIRTKYKMSRLAGIRDQWTVQDLLKRDHVVGYVSNTGMNIQTAGGQLVKPQDTHDSIGDGIRKIKRLLDQKKPSVFAAMQRIVSPSCTVVNINSDIGSIFYGGNGIGVLFDFGMIYFCVPGDVYTGDWISKKDGDARVRMRMPGGRVGDPGYWARFKEAAAKRVKEGPKPSTKIPKPDDGTLYPQLSPMETALSELGPYNEVLIRKFSVFGLFYFGKGCEDPCSQGTIEALKKLAKQYSFHEYVNIKRYYSGSGPSTIQKVYPVFEIINGKIPKLMHVPSNACAKCGSEFSAELSKLKKLKLDKLRERLQEFVNQTLCPDCR